MARCLASKGASVLNSTGWVVKWEGPLPKGFRKALSNLEGPTSQVARVIDDFLMIRLHPVADDTGLSAFKIVLRLAIAHLDTSDQGEHWSNFILSEPHPSRRFPSAFGRTRNLSRLFRGPRRSSSSATRWLLSSLSCRAPLNTIEDSLSRSPGDNCLATRNRIWHVASLGGVGNQQRIRHQWR